MTAWNCTAVAVVDRPVDQLAAAALGREVAGSELVAVVVHEDRVGVTSVPADAEANEDPLGYVSGLRDRLVEALVQRGVRVTGWAALEVLSGDEVDRRIASSSTPDMVNTEGFAALCGVSRQRISELETERRNAAAEGKPHAFPAPVVPGWWVRAGAERYAATRKRKPGPKPRKA